MKYNMKRTARNFHHLCLDSTKYVLHILEFVTNEYGVIELLFSFNYLYGIIIFQTKQEDKSLEIAITMFSLFPKLVM